MKDTWYNNIAVWISLISWLTAQTIKIIIMFIRKKRINLRLILSTGGMPSAHSSMVSGLAISIGIQKGFSSPIFAVAAVLAGIVMFDAQSVRRATGQQAKLLNQIIKELFQEHHFSKTKLAELLGHTRMEVFFGMLTGIIVAMVIHYLFK